MKLILIIRPKVWIASTTKGFKSLKRWWSRIKSLPGDLKFNTKEGNMLIRYIVVENAKYH